MNKQAYLFHLRELQIELVKLQYWIQQQGFKVVILFEGRDASGKGGIIKAITERLNPRHVKVVALDKPSDREKTQWYFQRYVAHLPAAGEMSVFDRSWYNRAGVEKVMGFCSDDEYQNFLKNCPAFESMLMESGIVLLKYWLSVSPKEQEKRFHKRLTDPLKRWKFSDMDLKARAKWVEYTQAKVEMMQATSSAISPWHIVPADDKKRARLNCISHILTQFDYSKIEFPHFDLPSVDETGYESINFINNTIKQIY